VAGPNAGHSVIDNKGTKWAFRQLPVSVVLERPEYTRHMIAAGSEVDGPVLLDEIDRVLDRFSFLDPTTIVVDPQATVIDIRHKEQEAADQLTQRVGSTAKGIGAARASRIMRDATIVGNDPWLLTELRSRGVQVRPTNQQPIVREVIIEGTQGYGLGLHAGHYPYCTSSNCRAIDFLAMAGISPWSMDLEVWAVARMYPIRVAGNSGPLANETTWESLGLPPEMTTVTQKVRRVGHWDDDLVLAAVVGNGGAPTVRLAITMADQRWPILENTVDDALVVDNMKDFISVVEKLTHAKVAMVTTGPGTAVVL
jgi:adenylosuccinate synthase